jgi:hypothetical protein
MLDAAREALSFAANKDRKDLEKILLQNEEIRSLAG